MAIAVTLVAVPNLSDMMLSQRLRELETAGILERHVIATSPVRVEYHLTQMGTEVQPVVDAVIAWSHRWIPLPTGEDDSTSHPESVTVSQGRHEQ